jgi:hypothetical protein
MFAAELTPARMDPVPAFSRPVAPQVPAPGVEGRLTNGTPPAPAPAVVIVSVAFQNTVRPIFLYDPVADAVVSAPADEPKDGV